MACINPDAGSVL